MFYAISTPENAAGSYSVKAITYDVTNVYYTFI